jgi:two-component system LytT family sensor kinase
MEENPTRSRRWIKWPLIALGWTIFGCFFASQVIVARAYAGRPLNLSHTIFVWLICAYVWLALTPLVLYLASRFAFERRSWTRNLLLHLAASIGFAFLQIAIYVSVASLIALAFNTVPSETFRSIFVSEFHFDMLTYWAIVGLSHAFDYYRKYREREIRASQLEARLARAQLDALKMQLHPHFLFNTLNTISVLMQEDVTVANRLLLRLSDLLRMALNTTDVHEVPLRQELEFLRNYLEIEQTRFQDRLTVRLDIDAEASEAQVPNLILQPLVENAIRYAVAPRATKSTIEISAARLNGQIKLQVRDDGPGISEAQKAIDLPGIGLRNTRSRLEKLYGRAHVFDISTPVGGGLQVTITLPFHTGKEDLEGWHEEHSDADC